MRAKAGVNRTIWGVVVFIAAGPMLNAQDSSKRPTLWMCPPAAAQGRALRELFEKPDQWKETRAALGVLGYADHQLNRQFSDEELGRWLPQLRQWGIRLALEVGAVKPWGPSGDKTFAIQRPAWNRFERLGGRIDAMALDEPLCCVRQDLHKPDEYAVEETARFIALVRTHYPAIEIGDIEPYPSLPLADLLAWLDALQNRLAEKKVAGLDFFRLDVDWVHFTVTGRGSWQEVKKLEQACRQRRVPFGLIYWAADYPAMQARKLADDATCYVSTLRQGYDYASVDGRPDQIVVQSWLEAPAQTLPETAEFTFARTVRDFSRKFVRGNR